ncbi:MAG TPA: hypothetical protein VEY11_10995 [Pyrinomonadaceae bacterium]|nr:hypothetical protein [Pyrinomonadaceae bacterium]
MKNDSHRRRVTAVSIDAQALMNKLNAPHASLHVSDVRPASFAEHHQEIIFFKH